MPFYVKGELKEVIDIASMLTKLMYSNVHDKVYN